MTLAKNFNIIENELKWQLYWHNHNIYKWDDTAVRAESFVIDTPPPTVSGHLHIGHVYSYTHTDFIARFRRMQGMNVFYPMGFDDNGLPTERLVEKQKKIRANTMSRERFIETCQEVIKDEEAKFRALFKQIGLSVDWSLEYQTISEQSRKISQMSFLDLIAKDEIYRSEQPVLWDPVDKTALAQADIEDKSKLSFMNYIIFHTTNGEQVVIATTRPEMLAACVAVLFHPDDIRYKHLKEQYAISPLFAMKVLILPDENVQPDKGSGLVMCCTFGDTTDIMWWQKHKLPLRTIINAHGILSPIVFEDDCQNPFQASTFYNMLVGLKIEDARNKIIEMLRTENLLIKQTEIIHNVKCAERSGAPLEILTSKQWFVRTLIHKKALLARIDEINWYPQSMKTRLRAWIENVAWDWCISRQRYFGVPFPVWYSKRSGEEGKVLFADVTQLPVNPIQDLPHGYSRDEVEPDLDVMDTWATSAVSPQLSTLAITDDLFIDMKRHALLFPMNLRPQAHEILRTWAFYTILKAHLHQNTVPWHNIMISGWCLAEDRSKMSKSKDNIVSPEKLLQEYGADITRYWASTSKLGTDTAYSERVMQSGKRLINKLWNAAKFISQYFDKVSLTSKYIDFKEHKNKITHTIDQWLINKLVATVKAVEAAMQHYEYATAMHLIEEFFWITLCDNYMETVKMRAYNADNADCSGQISAIYTLYHCLNVILKLFAPFLPYITEEIYTLYRSDKDAESIHSKGAWPNLNNWQFITDNTGPEAVLYILELVRKVKSDHNISIKAPITLIEVLGISLDKALDKDLKNVTSAHQIQYVNQFSANSGCIVEHSKGISVNILL